MRLAKWMTILLLLAALTFSFSSAPVNAQACHAASPQFGIVGCQITNPPVWISEEKQFQALPGQQGWKYSSITFSCLSDCMLEKPGDIKDPQNRSLGSGADFCGSLADYSVAVYKGPSKVTSKSPGGSFDEFQRRFPVKFDRDNPLTIEMYCQPVVGQDNFPVLTRSSAKIRKTQLLLYETAPGERDAKLVENSTDCSPENFAIKYMQQEISSGTLPSLYINASGSIDGAPGDYKTIGALIDELTPGKIKIGQNYSFLYGWSKIQNTDYIGTSAGNFVCGGMKDDKKIFYYSNVNTSSSCYLIPTSSQRPVGCCRDTDCASLGDNAFCDSNLSCIIKEPVYSVSLSYFNRTLSLKKVQLALAMLGNDTPEEGYIARLRNSNGTEIRSVRFFVDDSTPERKEVSFDMPYSAEGIKIEIYDREGQLKAAFDAGNAASAGDENMPVFIIGGFVVLMLAAIVVLAKTKKPAAQPGMV